MDDLVLRTASRIKAAIIIGKDGDIIAAALKKHAPNVALYEISNTTGPNDLMDKVVTCARDIWEVINMIQFDICDDCTKRFIC